MNHSSGKLLFFCFAYAFERALEHSLKWMRDRETHIKIYMYVYELLYA